LSESEGLRFRGVFGVATDRPFDVGVVENTGSRLLREWRSECGLSTRAAGELFGAAGTLVSRWERGLRRPCLRAAFSIEDVTGGAVPARSWLED
jgi:hypothetical protein